MLDSNHLKSVFTFLTSVYLDNFKYHLKSYNKSDNIEINKSSLILLIDEFLEFSKKVHESEIGVINKIVDEMKIVVYKISTQNDFNKLFKYLLEIEYLTYVWVI